MLFNNTIIDPPPLLGDGRGNYFKIFIGNPILNVVFLRQIEEGTARRATVGVWRTTAYYKRQCSAVRGHFSFRIRIESIFNNFILLD